MDNREIEKNKRNIDLITIAVAILICIPIIFAENYIDDSFRQSELLNEQTENVEELKKLYLELNNSEKLSNEHSNLEEKLSRVQTIEFNLEYIKQSHKEISLSNNLIKFVLSALIVPLLIKILINRQRKLRKVIELS